LGLSLPVWIGIGSGGLVVLLGIFSLVYYFTKPKAYSGPVVIMGPGNNGPFQYPPGVMPPHFQNRPGVPFPPQPQKNNVTVRPKPVTTNRVEKNDPTTIAPPTKQPEVKATPQPQIEPKPVQPSEQPKIEVKPPEPEPVKPEPPMPNVVSEPVAQVSVPESQPIKAPVKNEDWKATVDPPPAMNFPPEDKKIQIPFKEEKPFGLLITTAIPSPFIVFVDHTSGEYEISTYSLPNKTPRKIKLKGDYGFHHTDFSLSNDGESLGTHLKKNRNQAVEYQGWGVFSTKTGRLLHEHTYEANFEVKDIALAGTDHIVVYYGDNAAKVDKDDKDYIYRVAVYNFRNKQEVASFTIENEMQEEQLAHCSPHTLKISPGGKYFTLLHGKKLKIYEVATAKLMGQCYLEEQSVGGPRGVGLCFSGDGKFVYFTVSESVGNVITTISMETGTIVSELTTKDTKNVFSGVRKTHYSFTSFLQDVPELNAFLVNCTYFFDKESGEAIYYLKGFEDTAFVVNGKLMICGARNKEGDLIGITDFQLPISEIRKVATVLSKGGTITDGILGESKVGNVANAKHLSIPTEKISGIPTIAPLITTQVPKKIIQIPIPGNYTEHGTHNLAVFNAAATTMGSIRGTTTEPTALLSYELETGKANPIVEMQPGSYLNDISPDGTLALVSIKKIPRDYSHSNRLEVYSIPQQKHVFSWCISHNAPASSEWGRSPLQFQYACFIEKGTALTQMGDNTLYYWKLPDATAIWKLEKVKKCMLLPDRTHALITFENVSNAYWLNIKTGEWQGELANGGTVNQIAISPNGKRMAQLKNNRHSTLCIQNLGEETSQEQIIESTANFLTWLNDRYLAVRFGSQTFFTLVYDTEQNNNVVWHLIGNYHAKKLTNGQFWFWYNGWYQSEGNKVPFFSNGFPSAQLLTKFVEKPGVAFKPLIYPGCSVTLGEGFPQDAAHLAAYEPHLKRLNWNLDSNAPVRISVKLDPETDDEYAQKRATQDEKAKFSFKRTAYIVKFYDVATGEELKEDRGAYTYRLDSSGKYYINVTGKFEPQETNPVYYQIFMALPHIVFPRVSATDARVGTSILDETGDMKKLPQPSATPLEKK
jgi:hypothetical protein